MSCFPIPSPERRCTAEAVYCLRWNEGKSEVFQTFQEYFYSGYLSDILLTVEGKEIRCHKLLLAATCRYFRDLLESQAASSVVAIRGVSYADLDAVIRFIYAGEVRLDEGAIRGFLEAAECLGVKGIVGGNNQSFNFSVTPVEVHKEIVDESTTEESAPSSGTNGGSNKNITDTGGAALDLSRAGRDKEHASTSPSTSSADAINDALDIDLGGGASAAVDLDIDASNSDRASDSGVDFGRRKASTVSNNLKKNGKRSKRRNSSSTSKAGKRGSLERRDETECTKGRRYKKYDENTLDQALRQILNGMSVGTAAKKFGVPVRTIYRQCRKKNVKPTRGSKKDVDESGGSETETDESDATTYVDP